MDADRDANGRFVAGNQASVGNNGGRPPLESAERLRLALDDLTDEETLQQWRRAMRRKIANGNQWATEFTFNRKLGKVPDKQEVTGAEGGPQEVRVIIEYVEAPPT